MPRIITPDENGDFISKDGLVIRNPSLSPNCYRFAEVQAWARDRGFVRSRSYRNESTRRAWTLKGTGDYEGWSIQCLNRSDAPHSPEAAKIADWFQTRTYTVFYGPFQIANYFPEPDLAVTFEEKNEHLIDLMLDDVLLPIIRGRQRILSKYRKREPSRPIVIKADNEYAGAVAQ